MVDVQNTAVADYVRQDLLAQQQAEAGAGEAVAVQAGLPVLQNDIDARCLACVGDTCKKVEEMLAIMNSTNNPRVEDQAFACVNNAG